MVGQEEYVKRDGESRYDETHKAERLPLLENGCRVTPYTYLDDFASFLA